MWPNFPQMTEKCAIVAEALDNNRTLNEFEFNAGTFITQRKKPERRNTNTARPITGVPQHLEQHNLSLGGKSRSLEG